MFKVLHLGSLSNLIPLQNSNRIPMCKGKPRESKKMHIKFDSTINSSENLKGEKKVKENGKLQHHQNIMFKLLPFDWRILYQNLLILKNFPRLEEKLTNQKFCSKNGK